MKIRKRLILPLEKETFPRKPHKIGRRSLLKKKGGNIVSLLGGNGGYNGVSYGPGYGGAWGGGWWWLIIIVIIFFAWWGWGGGWGGGYIPGAAYGPPWGY